MKRKKRIAILFGGRSAEHEISLQSAENVYDAIDKKKYDIVLIGIDKKGKWHNTLSLKEISESSSDVLLQPARLAENAVKSLKPRANTSITQVINALDVVFPVLHGPYGEDGSVQGLLKLINVPYVGAGILASAVGMDKDIMKRLLRDAGLPIAKFLVYEEQDREQINFERVKKELGLPVFVKPANLGSSVGVSKVQNESELRKAVEEAFQFDRKLLIEECIHGREIECSVLGNEHPIASLPGEVIPQKGFYSYEAKYLDENGAILEIPAKLDKDIVRRIQAIALKAFKTLCGEGMSRVDMFLQNGKIYVNEVNTIPGFTRISMYPKLWEASGISYSELIDRLIDLAIERFQREQKLKTSYK